MNCCRSGQRAIARFSAPMRWTAFVRPSVITSNHEIPQGGTEGGLTEIDDMPAKKSGKDVEWRLLDTWRRACDEMQYRGSVSDWEILMLRLGKRERRSLS